VRLATGGKIADGAKRAISPLYQNITPPTMQKSRGAPDEGDYAESLLRSLEK
jgi:hypothetical protein